jgi:hypothetical protein
MSKQKLAFSANWPANLEVDVSGLTPWQRSERRQWCILNISPLGDSLNPWASWHAGEYNICFRNSRDAMLYNLRWAGM